MNNDTTILLAVMLASFGGRLPIEAQDDPEGLDKQNSDWLSDQSSVCLTDQPDPQQRADDQAADPSHFTGGAIEDQLVGDKDRGGEKTGDKKTGDPKKEKTPTSTPKELAKPCQCPCPVGMEATITISKLGFDLIKATKILVGKKDQKRRQTRRGRHGYQIRLQEQSHGGLG